MVLAELRAAPQCGAAVHVTVVPYDDYRVGATWDVASCNPGASAPEACERALCDIVSRLQQRFDIAGEVRRDQRTIKRFKAKATT